MKEEFLHWVWKNGMSDMPLLAGVDPVEVISAGAYNRDSGPDFFNTRILYDGVEWAGNTEIHINASDWYRHGHHTDHAYDNVVLHLVQNNDTEVYTASGRHVLTITMMFSRELWNNYLDFVNDPAPLPCAGYKGRIDTFRMRHWLGSLAVSRLERKSSEVRKKLEQTGYDWEETFYCYISRYFGFRVNRDPFEMLSSRLPLKIIRKHSDNLLQVEALLYGTAGMLDDTLFREAVNDEYYRLLYREFSVLKAKYSLQPVEGWLWKFHRLRPSNFPTVRLSQMAMLMSGGQGLFSRVLECTDVQTLDRLLTASASVYWSSHYVFGRRVRNGVRNMGRQAADNLIINAVVPLLFVYGKIKHLDSYCERALDLLEALPAEDNSITVEFSAAGVTADSAFITQALTELRNSLCRSHKCLDCFIGSELIALGHELKKPGSLLLEP